MPKFLKAKIKTHLLFVIGSRGSSRLVQPGDLLHHTGDLLYERVYHHRRFLKAVL
jgi:hypothetical protein